MRRFLCTLITLLWGLWFGGVVMLFVSVTSIFAVFPHHPDVAGQAAARVFDVFNAYQLVLAAASLLGTFIWYVVGAPKLKAALFATFLTAAVAACVVTFYIAPRIVELQAKGLVHTATFNRLHGSSMIVYLIEVITLLIGGAVLARIRQ